MSKFIKTISSREEYFKFDALNKSFLAMFDENPRCVIDPPVPTTGQALEFGDAVDTLIFDGPEEFSKRFYLMETEKPTSTSLEFANEYINAILINDVATRDTTLGVNICKEKGFWSNVKKEETLINKFNNDLIWNYIDSKVEANGKITIGP